MPSKFSGVLDTQEPPDVGNKYEVDTTTDANMIQRAGKAWTDLFEGMKAGQNEDALGVVSAELADIESSVVAYNEALADIRERTLSADEGIRKQAASEFEQLAKGNRQGALSPSAARLRTNAAIKRYSVAYPHLTKDIRTIANQSMDNYAAIQREVFGDDPVSSEINKLYSTATSLGTDPLTVQGLNGATRRSEAALASYKLSEAANSATKESAIQAIQTASFESSKVDTFNLANSWNERLLKKIPISAVDAKREIQQAKDDYFRRFQGELIGRPGITNEDIKNSLAPAMAMFDSLYTIMESTGTIEQQTALAKLLAEKNAAEKDSAVANWQANVGGFIGSLPPGQAMEALQAAVWVATNKTTAINSPDWDKLAQNAVANGDITFVTGLQFARTEQGQKYIGEITGKKVSGQNVGRVDPVINAVANRQADEIIGRITAPELRQQLTSNVIGDFTWLDIFNNKNVATEAAKNPALRDDAMGKAAAYAADLIGGRIDPARIVVDHRDFANPIKIKGQDESKSSFVYAGRAPTAEEMATMSESDRLDFMYHSIINTFGAAGIDLWVSKLGLDAKPKDTMNPDGTAKKKVSKSSGEGEVMGKIRSINDQSFGLPKALVDAFADQESDFGRNYEKDAGAGARGPLQITEGTFKLMNDQYYKGALSFDNEDHQIIASLTLLKYLYHKHKADIGKMAMEYYSGTTDPNRRPKKGVPGPSAGDYATSVTTKYYNAS